MNYIALNVRRCIRNKKLMFVSSIGGASAFEAQGCSFKSNTDNMMIYSTTASALLSESKDDDSNPSRSIN